MNRRLHLRPSSVREAFSLVELTIALGIMAFCLLAIFGLLPVGITSNRNAVATTEAAGVATNVLAEMRLVAANTLTGATITTRYGLSFGAGSTTLYFSDAGEYLSDAGSPNAKFRVQVNRNADPANAHILWVQVLVTWPAQADPTKSSGRFSAVTAVKDA